MPQPQSQDSDSPRLRVATVILNANRWDGTGRAAAEVAERLAQRHEVHLFARTVDGMRLDGIRWHCVPGPRWPDVVDFASFVPLCGAMLSGRGFDVVHSHGCNVLGANVYTVQNVEPAKRAALEALGRGERVALPRRLTRRAFHAAVCAAERRAYRPTARPTPWLIAVSRGTARDLSSHYAVDPQRLRIIPNGVDLDTFRPCRDAAERQRVRRDLGLSDDDFVAVFSGGDWHRKGLEHAIAAIALIPDPAVKLLVLGDDPLREPYVEQARKAGLDGRVCFAGFRRDVAECYRAGDVFVFPTCYEAFSLATLEAAASGLPVIASPANGVEDMLSGSGCGCVVRRDAAEIADAIAGYRREPDTLTTAATSARTVAETRFNWDSVADAVERVYFDAVSRA